MAARSPTTRRKTTRRAGALAGLLLAVVAGPPAAAQDTEPFGSAGSRRGSFLETDSQLGTFKLGVSGLAESERMQATTGDLELGYVRLYELDQMFPRVLELVPFALNRFESTDESTYQSLGFGGGLRFAVRPKYEKNNWFARASVITPTDYYNQYYSSDRKNESIAELFLGIEVPFNDPRTNRDIVRRTLGPLPITVYVSPELFAADRDAAAAYDPAELADLRADLIAGYLEQVLSDYLTEDVAAGVRFRSQWNVIRLLDRLTEIEVTEVDAQVMFLGRIDGKDGRAYRRDLIRRKLKQGLTEVMRGPYPLMLAPTPDEQPDPGPGSNPGSNPDVSTTTTVTTRLSVPGMTLGTGPAAPLNCDAMIDAYIDRFIDRNVRP